MIIPGTITYGKDHGLHDVYIILFRWAQQAWQCARPFEETRRKLMNWHRKNSDGDWAEHHWIVTGIIKKHEAPGAWFTG
jgi:hypothetical protein